MYEEHRHLTWTLMLLFLTGALCNVWKVKQQQRLVYAVKGSSVVFLCSFHNPENQIAKRVLWGHAKPGNFMTHWISSSLRTFSRRFQYIGDTYHNCSLKIHQVECSDAGSYFVRFNTMSNRPHEKNVPVLKVIDLAISMSKLSVKEAIREGDSVNLTCTNICDGDKISFVYTWFKNGEPIHEGAALYLRNMSPTSSGNYTCSLKTYSGATSGVLRIDVEYGPRNTTVLVQPSFGADPGSNLTLICSSHAYPPVENYTWFRIAAGDSVNVGHQPVFLPSDRDQYLCSVTNKHGSQNSSVVTLNIKKNWPTFCGYIPVLVIITVAVVLIVTTFIAVRRLHKKRMRTPVEGGENESQNADCVDRLSMCDNNQSQERERSEGETTEMVYAAVCFHTKRKPSAEQQKDTQCEDVIYSTVCRPVCAALKHPQSRQEGTGPIYASPKRKQTPYPEEGAYLLSGSKF